MNGRILVAHVSDASVLQADVTISTIAPEEGLTHEGLSRHVGAVVLCSGNCHQSGWTVSARIKLGYAVAIVKVGHDFCAVPTVSVHAAIGSHDEFVGGFWEVGEGMVV